MSANPHANGGKLLVDLDLPDSTGPAPPVRRRATEQQESPGQLGLLLRDVSRRTARQRNFRLFCPDETNSNRLGAVFEVENRCFGGPILDIDDHVARDGRVMEVLSEHSCEGWLEGYLLTGRHGLFATYEAFAMISASMTVQHAKWLEEGIKLEWRRPIASLNVLLTSTCWRNDHNGFSHQGPGLIDTMLSKKGAVARIYLPPDANCLLSVADHCLRSRNYVNLIVIDKQPQLQWLDIDAARAHCTRGASVWSWASNDDGREPDVVLAAAGDVPTLETVAAAWLIRKHAPELRVRVVNVIDLMTLFPPDLHPHGIDQQAFVDLFTSDRPVVFAFHGYQRAIHEIVHGRPAPDRFHVRGFNEQGTTTTPFDMVVLNGMSRYHLCIEALRRVRSARATADRCVPGHARPAPALRARAHGGHARGTRLDLVGGLSVSPSLRILCLNTGSSSLKFALYELGEREVALATGAAEGIGNPGARLTLRKGGDTPTVDVLDQVPDVKPRFPLPGALGDGGIRRYGFHGLSYEYVVYELGAASRGRVVIAHLGSGASMAAVHDGRSVETTMGLTPTGGLMMGTRPGDLDPGVLLHLLATRQYDVEGLTRLVERESGLLGVSGLSADMRTLLAARDRDQNAARAIAMFCHRARREVGALAAVLGGMDSLVFTGGVGEHSAEIRQEICRGLEHLGVVLDMDANGAHAPILSPRGAACVVRVVETNEDLMVARHTRAVLQGRAVGTNDRRQECKSA